MTAPATFAQLYPVGSQPLDQAVEEVKRAAHAIWHRGYCPTRTELDRWYTVMSSEEFQQPLCVLELLSQDPVCRRNIARELQRLTRFFR